MSERSEDPSERQRAVGVPPRAQRVGGASSASEGRPSGKDVSRISAWLRQRGGVLIAYGDWPRCDARLSLRDAEWVGLGRGHGHLQARRVTVEVRRGTAPARTGRLWLPDRAQAIRRVEDAPTRLRSVS